MSTKTVKTPVGKTVTWSVTLEGYVPQRGSYVMGDNPVNLNINLVSYKDAPFTIEALDDGGIQGIDTTKNVQYNKNNTGWVTATSNSIDFSEGDVIQFKAEYDSFYSNNWLFNEHARINVYGNIGSLLDPVNYSTITTYQSNHTFAGFFRNAGVVDASNLILPATTLVENCYNEMFSGCTLLTSAPTLPATTLANFCYSYMFQRCTSLTTAPTLPATTLAEFCYDSMFEGCTSLVTPPTLPATTLADSCYVGMFRRCTSLTTTPTLPAAELVNQCYAGMFSGCTSLTSATTLPATTLASYCYSGMFDGCTSLTSAPTLPVTTLARYCYSNMFEGCTALTTAPVLPATTLADSCYMEMFRNCTALINAPALPATVLANSCYRWMFAGCTALTTAPVLPAETLVPYCYMQMFQGCSNLNYIKCLAHDISANYCRSSWTDGVAPTGTFVRYFYNNDWPTGTSGIPVGWVVETVGIEQHTVTINPTPADAVVIINGEAQNSIYDWYGTSFNWAVSAPHYVTQSGTKTITGNETMNVILALEQHTFTINPTPADAIVTINGQQRTSITADYGTTINWSVSKTHYVTQSGTLVLEQDTTLPVSLALEQHTFTIVPTPADAVVTINSEVRNSITADYGATINWSVSKEHYVTQSGTLVLEQDTTLPVSLSLEQHTFTIVPTPADAVVTINGEVRSSITANYGTAISWSVSKEHYVTQSDTTTLAADTTLPVSLALEQHTFTINPTPADAVVTINDQQRSSITADYGTYIEWSVSKNEYTTKTGSYILYNDHVENVELDPQCIIEGTCKNNTAKIGYNREPSGYFYNYSLFDITYTRVSTNLYRFVARSNEVVTSLAGAFNLEDNIIGVDSNANAGSFLTITSMRGTDKCTDAQRMLGWCTSLTSYDLSKANFSKVTNINGMYRNLTGINSNNNRGPSNLKPQTAQYLYMLCGASSGVIDTSDIDWSNLTRSQGSSDGAYNMFWSCNYTNYNLSNTTIRSSMYRAFDHAGKLNTPMIIVMDNTYVKNTLYRIFGDTNDYDDHVTGPLSSQIYIYARRLDPNDQNLIYVSDLSNIETGFWHYGYTSSTTDNPTAIGLFPWGNPNLGSAYVGEYYYVYSNNQIVTHGFTKTKYTNGYVSLNISGMTKDGIPDGHGGYVIPTVNFSAGPNGAYNLSAYNWKTGSSYRYNYWYNTTGTTIRYSVSAPGFNTVTGTATPRSGSSTSTGGTQTINITLTPTS